MSYEQIWAPWRLEFIQGGTPTPDLKNQADLLPDADPQCFLCRAVAEGDDRTRLVVARGRMTITVLNRYPYNNGHLLVSPHRHVGRLGDLTSDEHLEIATTVTEMVEKLERLLDARDFNIGVNLGLAAGAGLPGHLHWHIVPRWNGDTNFMPCLAGVRVIPQSLEALRELLAGSQD